MKGTAAGGDPTAATFGRPGLASVSEIADCIGSTRTLADLFRELHTELSRSIEAPVFMLALYDDVSQTVEVVRQIDRGQELEGGSFPLGKGFTSRAIRERRAILISDWSTDGPAIQVLYGTEEQQLVRPESGMTAPLLTQDRVIGVISVQSYRRAAFDQEDLHFFRAVAAVTAAVVDSLRRSQLAGSQARRRISELEAILASMTDALVIVDARGALTRMNHAARDVLSLGPGTIVMGQPLLVSQLPDRWPFGAQEVAESLTAMFERLRRGEAVREMEVELKSAPVRVLSFGGAPLVEPEGGFGGAVIIIRDVTTRREVERLKDDILGTASHDLRVPITAIKGHAQLLARKLTRGAEPSDLAQGVAVIERQADRLVDLVDVLLDVSRIQVGRLELEQAPTDLVALIASIVEGVRGSSPNHEFAIDVPGPVEGSWDRRRVGQVLENLLTNAVRYSPSGGTIRLSADRGDREVTIRVTDTGIGLAASEIPHVFERDYRGERARALHAGSGLGLFICHAVVAAHGGRIWAESKGPGTGSTFAFTLPAGSAR